MTIARRLTVLLAVPLLILSGIGVFTRYQLLRIEDRTRFVAESRVPALTRLGDISRSFAELRVNLTNHLLATDASGRAQARSAFDEDKLELSRLLTDYADKRSTSDHGRRLLDDFRRGSQQWTANAEQAMALADAGQQQEAIALLFGPSIAGVGATVRQGSLEWIKYNQEIAEDAGTAALGAIDSSQRSLLAAIVLALAFSGFLGFVTFRSIVTPIRALEASVTTIAGGDYAQAVPFTKATDETGGLARSIDVLKRGAGATEGQRWVKSNISVLTAALQGANSLNEFGERLVSTLVPMLGGGLAAFYILDENTKDLRRVAGYGLPAGAAPAGTVALGEGLVGQCARERKPIALGHVPPEYFQIESGLGAAPPIHTVASPVLSKDDLLGVLEVAGFRAAEGREKTLLDEVLPVIGMNLEILQSSLATQQLLTQTQAQARQLEQQTADLAVAKGKAEEATQMKSMFLANMSHEIRTPMNAIIGLSYLALKTPLSEKQRDYVSKVHTAGTSLLAIINDILDFSKIEAGKLDIETTDFQVDEVIGSVVTLTAQKAHEKGLEFLADVAPAIPGQLRGDPLRLAQVLTNLVNNAVKFTERGEIRLKIEQLERQGDRVQLRFSVRDTGIGMTREQAAKLFQPFSQADMSTTRKHGGTGLGLTISRRLVELMGGEISLDSVAGTGSTFEFTVWLEVGHAGQARVVPGRLQGLRLLVVDDNAAAREILVESLKPLAQRADAVSSGAEAIAAIRERDADEPYDAVFMDWRMPGMDGLEASRLIKSDASIRKQPAIVMVTAFGREDVREEAETLQLDGFLLKPVTKSMLVDSLVHIFATDVEKGTAASATPADTPRVLPGARILLVEDNTINQQIAVELLEGAGATVTIAANGREAVDALMRVTYPPPYDIVLMDLQMPEMDGYQATAQIRSDSRFASLPIIAMTAHATLEERTRCLDAGMNDHVSKPIHPDVLFATVSRYYHPAASAEPAARAVAAVPMSAAAPGDALPVVDGLDTADGLLRVGNNRALYLKLLRQFVEEAGNAAERIRDTLAGGDRAGAERMAHTVKGVGGNLGATEVQAAADAVERAVKDGTPPIEPLCSRLAEALSVLVKAVGGLTPAGPASDGGQTGVRPQVSGAAVTRMARCLAEFDPAAVECLESDRSTFQALFDPATLAEFERHVGTYAFADAQGLLDAALLSHGISPGGSPTS
jgi:signal transduction histidine kinase/DNA-binding response OmpR family regulator/HPt (histidine-containing phosphotransfer) domain-containing protein/HAMP domain-containing protein